MVCSLFQLLVPEKAPTVIKNELWFNLNGCNNMKQLDCEFAKKFAIKFFYDEKHRCWKKEPSLRPPQSVQLFFASVADQVLNFRWTLFYSFDVKTPADNFLANVLQLHLLCVLIERSAAFDVGFLFDSVAFRNFNRLFSLLQMSAAIQASSRDHCSEFVLKCVLQSLQSSWWWI